jgi:hypothetical protein
LLQKLSQEYRQHRNGFHEDSISAARSIRQISTFYLSLMIHRQMP